MSPWSQLTLSPNVINSSWVCDIWLLSSEGGSKVMSLTFIYVSDWHSVVLQWPLLTTGWPLNLLWRISLISCPIHNSPRFFRLRPTVCCLSFYCENLKFDTDLRTKIWRDSLKALLLITNHASIMLAFWRKVETNGSTFDRAKIRPIAKS